LKIDIWDVRERYQGFLYALCLRRLTGRDEIDILTVIESVYKDLERIGECRGEAELRALVSRVAYFNIIDHIRRWTSKKNYHPRSFQLEKHGEDFGGESDDEFDLGDRDGGIASPQTPGSIGADPAAEYEAAQEGADQGDITTVADLARKYGIKSKSLALMEDRIAGLSRLEIAEKHGLSENQAHCRLVYLRRQFKAKTNFHPKDPILRQ